MNNIQAKAVVIGVSAGGFAALGKIIPVIIAQHLHRNSDQFHIEHFGNDTNEIDYILELLPKASSRNFHDKQAKILVVDYLPGNLHAMGVMLEPLDVAIDTASSGNKALSLMLKMSSRCLT